MLSYWTVAIYKRILNTYSTQSQLTTKFVRIDYFPFVQPWKKNAVATPLGSYNFLKLNKNLTKLLEPLFIYPSLLDLNVAVAIRKQQPHLPPSGTNRFLLPKAKTALDTAPFESKKANFFLLKKAFFCIQSTLTRLLLYCLQHWILVTKLELTKEFFYLLQKERELLVFFDTNKNRPINTRNKTVVKVKRKLTVTKKSKPNKYTITNNKVDLVGFLIRLTKISSRAGARLRNFRYYTSFLVKLRKIGGLTRLADIIRILNPFFYFRKRYRGRKSFFVPLIVAHDSRVKFISRNLLNSVVRRTTERSFPDRLFREICDILQKRGKSYKYKKSILNLVNLHKFNIKRRFFRKHFLRRRIFY